MSQEINEYPTCPRGHLMLTDKKTSEIMQEKYFVCTQCRFRIKEKKSQ